jgi:hypothetical protein
MKLLKVFNKNFLEVIRILNKSFTDVADLSEELQKSEMLISEDESCKAIHDEFVSDVDQKVIDQIFQNDEKVISENMIGFCSRCNMSSIFQRMYDGEKEVFWKNLQALCRYSSMLRACGEQLSDMEGMAMDFMQDNKNCPPEDYHMKLFQEMLSGGEMSKKLMSTFKDPSCIKNILSNVGNIMKANGDEKDGMSDFASLLNMPFSEEDMKEVTKGVQDTLSKNISNHETSDDEDERVVDVSEIKSP